MLLELVTAFQDQVQWNLLWTPHLLTAMEGCHFPLSLALRLACPHSAGLDTSCARALLCARPGLGEGLSSTLSPQCFCARPWQGQAWHRLGECRVTGRGRSWWGHPTHTWRQLKQSPTRVPQLLLQGTELAPPLQPPEGLRQSGRPNLNVASVSCVPVPTLLGPCRLSIHFLNANRVLSPNPGFTVPLGHRLKPEFSAQHS